MTVYGNVTLGRLTLTEDPTVAEKASSGRTLALAGMEACPPLLSQAAARERVEGLQAYVGATLPVLFETQSHRNGWYMIRSTDATELTWDTFTGVRWKAELEHVGRDAEVEIESRLIGGNRQHVTGATAELWHAPAVGADSYLVGTATPGYVDRVGATGTVRCFRSLGADINPRWAPTVADYLGGAAQITVSGTLRTGTTCDDTPTSWSLDNGLLKVEPRTSAGTLRLTSYLSAAWGTAKVFDLKRGTTSLGAAQHVTILRNDPCEAVIRLTWDHAPGRTTADLSLKRGSRSAAIYLQQYAAASALRVDDNGVSGTVNDALASAGYINDTVTDGDGNRWVIGSPIAVTAAGTFGLAASVAALGLSAFIGCVRGGASPASGDSAADVNAQYLGTPSETERVILR